MTKRLHVVAAVIENTDGKILIAKRPQHVHQGGLWEFPGGKVEADETANSALQRELSEELNIQITDSQPLIQINHNYPDKSVFLDVYHVTTFSGKAVGNEGQEIKWIKKNKLSDFEFPAANKPIIDATQLPHEYLITPEHELSNRTDFLERLELNLQNGIRLIQLRAKSLSDEEFAILYHQTHEITRQYGVKLQLNTSLENAIKLQADGIHLTSANLLSSTSLPSGLYASASCHNLKEIQKACDLGVRFIVIAPIQLTTTHPEARPLGWQNFSQLCEQSTVPAFALGGMKKTDSSLAIANGGQGIAAISGLW